MVSLHAKHFGKNTYYYLRWCERVDGRPKIVSQKYLGTAQDVARALAGEEASLGKIRDASVLEWGALVALYDVATQINLVQIVDRHVPMRTHGGPSVGTYLLVATLNRCVGQRSKAQMGSWFDSTVLPGLLDVQSAQLTSQRFWDHMNRVSEEAIVAIERDLTSQVLSLFQLDLRALLFDETNFFTFIHSFNTRSTLAQRGHCKEGRGSLRILGLALLVTADFDVPLFHHLYAGNQTDAPTFRSVLDELVARYRLLEKAVEDITLVFDKGNNAQDNLDQIDQSPYHFVGSLVLTQHPDLLAIPSRHLAPLKSEELSGVKCRRLSMEVMGKKRTVLVTYNDALFEAQSETLDREIKKRVEKLRRLQVSLARWHRGKSQGKRPTKESVSKQVDKILIGQHMKTLLSVEVDTAKGGLPRLRYRFDGRQWDRLCELQLGKTILFTDREDWDDERIIMAYRSQWHVEHAFRRMKDVRYLSFRPQRHWTDQKVRVHALYCVMALLLVSLLRKRLSDQGIQLGSYALLEALSGIRQVGAVEAGKLGRPRMHTTLTKRNEIQEKLVQALGLMRYAST